MDGSPALRFGRFELQARQRRLLRDGESLPVGARAFDVLLALAERRDRIVTKAELIDLVWPGLVVEENNLQVQISSLRRLLGSDAIATIPGRGYQFTAQLAGNDESGPSIKRRLAAIMAADVAGYSRLMGGDESATVMALDAARGVFKTWIESARGRVIDMAGDSVLAVFETASGAVSTALAVQDELRGLGADVSEDRRMRFRIGVHLGDVIEKPDGTVYGDGVNIAARLQAIAEPGGVVVSQTVQSTCADHLGAAFEDIGPQSVKNIAKPIRAFRLIHPHGSPDVRSDLDGRAGWKRSRVWLSAVVVAGVVVVVAGVFFAPTFRTSSAARPPARVVNIDQEILTRRATAVLAFVDKSGAKTGSTLGDDLADAIAGRMVHAGVRVIGRAATVRQDPSAPDFVRIGQEQGVRFVVAGRIARQGDVTRVDAYLTEIASGAVFRLHEDQFNSDEEAMRSDYGNAVARALIARYYEIEAVRARSPGHEKDPVDLLVLGWRELDRGNTSEELESARTRFELVVKADPNSEEASYGLGLAYLSQFYCLCSASPREKLDGAEKALRRALDLAPDNPQSLAAWADILLLRQRPDEALRVWRKTLEISPDNQNAHLRMAGALVKQGQLADAQAHLARVTDLQPHQLLRQQWLLQTLADASFSQGRDDDAYKILQNWTAEFPNNGKPYLMMAAIDALHGRDAAAAANLTRHHQMLPLSTISYVVLTYPSTDPGFLSQRERLISGLRKAGLPEGTQ